MSHITTILDIEELIEQLPIGKRIQLVQRLEKSTWVKRLDNIVNKIRAQIKRIPSEEEIARICEKARKKVYAKHKGSH